MIIKIKIVLWLLKLESYTITLNKTDKRHFKSSILTTKVQTRKIELTILVIFYNINWIIILDGNWIFFSINIIRYPIGITLDWFGYPLDFQSDPITDLIHLDFKNSKPITYNCNWICNLVSWFVIGLVKFYIPLPY